MWKIYLLVSFFCLFVIIFSIIRAVIDIVDTYKFTKSFKKNQKKYETITSILQILCLSFFPVINVGISIDFLFDYDEIYAEIIRILIANGKIELKETEDKN